MIRAREQLYIDPRLARAVLDPRRACVVLVPPWPRRALLDAHGHVVYAGDLRK